MPTNDTALSTNTQPAPTAATTNPPIAGPTARARFMFSPLSAAACGSSERSTRSGWIACQAGADTAVPQPRAKVRPQDQRRGRRAQEGHRGQRRRGDEHRHLRAQQQPPPVDDVGERPRRQGEQHDRQAGGGLHQRDQQRRACRSAATAHRPSASRCRRWTRTARSTAPGTSRAGAAAPRPMRAGAGRPRAVATRCPEAAQFVGLFGTPTRRPRACPIAPCSASARPQVVPADHPAMTAPRGGAEQSSGRGRRPGDPRVPRAGPRTGGLRRRHRRRRRGDADPGAPRRLRRAGGRRDDAGSGRPRGVPRAPRRG